MLELAMKAITMQLNSYIHSRFDIDEDAAILSPPYDLDGNTATKVNNKLVVFLTNINKDTLPNANAMPSSTGSSFISSKPLYLNLYVVIGACFDASRYDESLKYLSHAIGCFQQDPILDGSNSPGLSDNIQKLILDIENVGINELSNMWGILGGSYVPSVLYKVRMLMIANENIKSREIIATTPLTSANTR